MKNVRLYWNHICVLHNYEKKFLEDLAKKLVKKGIRLEVRYFGLGYPEHMSEYLQREDAVLPDLIVSADLEVFEDSRIFNKFEHDLHLAQTWIPLRQGRALELVSRGEKLLPFLAIPLIYYSSSEDCCQEREIHQIPDLAFGGVNNSAGKTLTKAVWSRYGKETASKVLENGRIADMPIGAFSQVRSGQCKTALVPSIYALRADGKQWFSQEPKEGPLLIPSFFCARKTLPEEIGRMLAEEILCGELVHFYEDNGNLLTFPVVSKGENWNMEKEYFTPDAHWYKTVSPEEFYELYHKSLPL